jgi:hypothetical protein
MAILRFEGATLPICRAAAKSGSADNRHGVTKKAGSGAPGLPVYLSGGQRLILFEGGNLFLQSKFFPFEFGKKEGIGGGMLEFLFNAGLQLAVPGIEFTDTRCSWHMSLLRYVETCIETPDPPP